MLRSLLVGWLIVALALYGCRSDVVPKEQYLAAVQQIKAEPQPTASAGSTEVAPPLVSSAVVDQLAEVSEWVLVTLLVVGTVVGVLYLSALAGEAMGVDILNRE